MTETQLKRLNRAIEKAMRMARAEHASNRLQNCLSAAVVIVRKEIKSKKSNVMKHEELAEKLREISDSLGKEGVMVCVFKGDEGGPSILMHGGTGSIIASLGLALNNDEFFRDSILTATKINLLLGLLGKKEGNDNDNVEQEADRITKDFLRNKGFKLEGEE